MVRYAADGSLDGTFGMGGKVVIDASVGPTSDSTAQALLIQPDGSRAPAEPLQREAYKDLVGGRK